MWLGHSRGCCDLYPFVREKSWFKVHLVIPSNVPVGEGMMSQAAAGFLRTARTTLKLTAKKLVEVIQPDFLKSLR
jgi:uncharacterized protein involved in propanediol utilization